MKKIYLIVLIYFIQTFTFGQNIIYKQSNKIIEYNYGIIDTADLKAITESEKIKYELKVVEKSYLTTINNSFESQFEINIDSNEYKKNWMKLAKKFKYSSDGIQLYDINGALIKSIVYTPEQIT
jgi:hypothetical protein